MLWTFSTVLLVLGLLGLVGGWTLVAFIDSLLVLAILFIFLGVVRGPGLFPD
jgi:hypothetical protein